MMIVYRGV